MTIDEAIKRLQEDIDSTGNDEIDTLTEAEKLGIEALKRVKDSRRPDPLYPETPLPGETEE
jgi:hypothetical protein